MTKTKKAAAKAPVTESAVVEIAEKPGKGQVVDLMTRRTCLSRKEAGAVFNSVLDVVADAIRSGKTAGLTSLGTLRVKATSTYIHRVDSPGLQTGVTAGQRGVAKKWADQEPGRHAASPLYPVS